MLHGIEPFAHPSEALGAWGRDPRLVEPMRAMIGHDAPELFTEKLNLKRPRHGGPNSLHQDYPYWVDSAQDATQVATTIVYLDDSSVDNGKWRTRHDAGEFGNNEIDQSAYPEAAPIPVELSAGSTVSFGAFLVHMSTPNRSDKDRRALLYSYQPAGPPHMLEGLRRLAAEVEARRAQRARERAQ